MKKFVIPKLIGLVLLTMITLVLISFAEVAVYSYLINPGQQESVYEAHANDSAPYISGIFGFIIFFLVARYWKKKEYRDVFRGYTEKWFIALGASYLAIVTDAFVDAHLSHFDVGDDLSLRLKPAFENNSGLPSFGLGIAFSFHTQNSRPRAVYSTPVQP